MAKSKSLKNRAKGLIRSASKSVRGSLPSINNKLKTTGVIAKNVAKDSLPIIEKGVEKVYGTLSTGLNLGISGVKNVASNIKRASTKRKSKRSRKSRRKH